jgi:hypothetical protein
MRLRAASSRPRRLLSSRLAPLTLAACLGAVAGCAAAPDEPAGPALPPVRGVVLISIDALRADALGLYGARRETSPFLDRLAERRGVVFENAFAQIPSTLPSHLSMLTGLYPSEHGVFPPSDVLAAEIPTLPELLRAAGFRTFGHSEGGYVQGGFGFARGFEEWTDTPYAADTDVERTFRRGLDSLARVGAGERFFLFLHTYAVHDPYDPPAAYRERFWPGPPPAGAFEPTGPNFAAFNFHLLDAPAEAVPYYRALYEAGVRHVDDVLAELVAGLERLGLADETAIVFTSDHGEEFLEHGRLVHTQAYPECLRIPLVVLHPGLARGRRVATIAETIDLPPTIAELAGIAAPVGVSGESLAPVVAGADGRLAGRAYAQDKMLSFEIRTVLLPVGGRLHQLHHARALAERDGFWASREVIFDARPPALELRAVAFHEPRAVEVRVGDRVVETLELGTEWRSYWVELPAGAKHVVSLRTPGCASPRELGLGDDRRCLSFKLDGVELSRLELFDLERDPEARHDLSIERPDLVRTLVRALREYPETPRAAASATELSDEQIRHLKALGYLQ